MSEALPEVTTSPEHKRCSGSKDTFCLPSPIIVVWKKLTNQCSGKKMHIKEISLKHTVNLGNYESMSFQATMVVEDIDCPETAHRVLSEYVYASIKRECGKDVSLHRKDVSFSERRGLISPSEQAEWKQLQDEALGEKDEPLCEKDESDLDNALPWDDSRDFTEPIPSSCDDDDDYDSVIM